MPRYANTQWNLPNESPVSYTVVQTALLMDIRDELQKLNRLLHCARFLAIPTHLDAIAVNTRKPKPKPKRQRSR